jgi:hypothetical protein
MPYQLGEEGVALQRSSLEFQNVADQRRTGQLNNGATEGHAPIER